jgi:VWFA-related protein
MHVSPGSQPYRMAFGAGFLLFSCLITFSEDKTTRKPQAGPVQSAERPAFTFKVPVDVVVVNATVTDKEGHPVKDLKVEDFKVYEDGKPQPIHTFALESYKATQGTEETDSRASPESVKEESEVTAATQPRFITIMIDDVTASSIQPFYRVGEAIREFVQNTLGSLDQVAFSAASGRVQYPFSNNKALLLEEIRELRNKLSVAGLKKPDCPSLTDLQVQRINRELPNNTSQEYQVALQEAFACLNLDPTNSNDLPMAKSAVESTVRSLYPELQYRSRTLLYALRQHVRSLKHLGGKKSLVLVSDGFLSEELHFEIQDVVDVALRSGVVFNTIDMRGLYTTSFQASENVVPSSPEMLSQKFSLRTQDASAQEDPLFQLANETGGLFYHNNNDFHAALKTFSERQSLNYVLTYASPSNKADGRYHKIRLDVSRPGLNVTYRKGYYSPKEQLTFERHKKEDIIEALQAPAELNEIPISFSFNYFQLEDFRYQIALVTRVSIRGLKFLEEESRHKNLINLVVVALDENDRYVDGLEKSVDFNLSSSSYSNLLDYGFSSKVDLRLPPGRYKIKAVVRESVYSKMGSISRSIEVP